MTLLKRTITAIALGAAALLAMGVQPASAGGGYQVYHYAYPSEAACKVAGAMVQHRYPEYKHWYCSYLDRMKDRGWALWVAR